jgi:branched-chain amino acid transport system substrate-binding protein
MKSTEKRCKSLVSIILFNCISLMLIFVVFIGCGPSAPTVPPIVIGAPCAQNNVAKNMYLAAQLAAEEINAKEGGLTIDGVKRPIKIVTVDTRDLEPGVPIQDVVLAYKDLISKEKPVALVAGPIRTEAVMALMENLAADKIVNIFCGSVSSKFRANFKSAPDKYKYLFKSSPTEIDLVMGLMKAMNLAKTKLNYNTAFLLIEDVDFAKAGAVAATVQLETAGWKVVGEVYTPLGMTDYSGALSKMKNSGAQAGFYIYSSEAAPLAKQYQAMQMSALMVGVCDPLGGPNAWNATQGAVKGWVNFICGAGNMPVQKMPKSVAFVDAYQKKYGEPPQIVLGCSQTYDAVYILAEAIKKTGSLDPDKLVSAIQSTEYNGVVGLTKFPALEHQSPYADDPATGLVCPVFQWWDGKRVPILPSSIAEGDIKALK